MQRDHVLIPLSLQIPGPTRNIKDRRIYNHFDTDFQPILLKIKIFSDRCIQLVAQIKRLK